MTGEARGEGKTYISVCNETETDGESHNSDLPEGNFFLGSDSLSSSPCTVHTSPDTDSVSDIIGSVSERSSASCDNLHERVEVFNFIWVFLGLVVDFVHAATFRCTEDSDLCAVNIVVETIEEGDDDVGWETDAEGSEVVNFVD